MSDREREREELAKLLQDQFNADSKNAGSLTFFQIAHAVLAHGYRRVQADRTP